MTLVLISILYFKSGVSNTVDYKRVKSFPRLPRFMLAVVNNVAEISEIYRSVYGSYVTAACWSLSLWAQV